MLGLFRRKPRLEAAFTPTVAVARESAREVEVAGELVVRNLGGEAALAEPGLVLVAGGTRRIDLDLPAPWRGGVRIPAGGELRERVAWRIVLGAPMRAPAAEIQLVAIEGGRLEPLARTARFPLAND